MTHDAKTPARLAYEEQERTRARLAEAGLSETDPTSNRTVQDIVEGHAVDSQGIEGSLERRAVPNASYGEATYDAYERYSASDRLAVREDEKRNGVVRYER